MALSVCIRKLEKATCIEDRIPIYKFLQSKKRLPALCSDEKYIVVLTTLLLKDISSDNNRVLQLEALHTLQLCLCCERIAESLNTNISQEITTILADQARTTECPEMYTELICTLSQLVPIIPEMMSAKLLEILECLERHFVKQYAPYVDVLCKVCHLFQRLITEIADSMIPHIKVWTPWVLFPLCHENNEVRDLAMKNLELCLPVFLMMEKTVLPLLAGSVKSHLAKEMTMLYPYQKEYVLKLWGTLVAALGITLHRGSSFINTLLEVIENAFKSEDEFVLIEAFNAWKNLITNFSTNSDIIGNSKRLKLLLQPLKLNIVTIERAVVAKSKTWWHIVWSLDDRLNSNFDLVCIPLLQYTFSSPLKNLDAKNTSPAATRSGKKQSFKSSLALGPKSNCLQKLGCEILSRLLEQPKWGSPGGLHSPKKIPNISLMPLKSFVSSNVYVQHISIFVHATKIAISLFGHDDSCASLNQYILQLLTSRTARLANDKDQSSIEAISEYFQLISDIVINEQCKVSQIIKLLEDMKMLPKEQLLTHILRVEYRGKSCNTPLLIILSIMLEPEILKSSFCSDRYFSVFNHFLSVSQGVLIPLSFFTSLMEMLKQKTPELSSHPRILCKIWSYVCLHLLEVIEKTQEVNQGNSLSCDFTGTTMVLAYPVQHFLTYDILQVCDKQLWKNWSDLYKAFARCSALVPSAEANVACEIIAKMMQENVSKKVVRDYCISLILFQLLQTIVDCIDYTALGKEFSEVSPSNWYRREEKPLHNITSFMSLLGNLLSVFSKLIEESQSTERKKDNKQLLEITSSLINIIQKLIANVTTSSLLRSLILKLLPYLVPFFSCITKKHRYGKTYNVQFQQNVEALWSTILTSLQLHYSGPYDTDFLESICPLLEANLMNSNQNNVERTRQFWHATFGCNLHNLILPTSFKNALKKVKPPLIPDIEVSPIEDTSSSLSPNQVLNEQAQSDSLTMTRNGFLRKSTGITDYQIQASLSTKKKQLTVTTQHSSSINYLDNNNAAKLSTVNKCKDKPVSPPSKNLLDNCSEKFVVIKPQKKKQILTEHQKEMKKNRSYVPAMYNDLSQSTIDIDTQSFSESSQVPTTQEIETLTIPSSTEDTVCENKEQLTNQEPVIILLESEQSLTNEIHSDISSGAVNSLNSSHAIEDGNSYKMELSVTSNENNKECNGERIPTNPELSSLSQIALESCSDNCINRDIDTMNEMVECGKEKNSHQEGNMNQMNVIEETEDVENVILKNDSTQNYLHNINVNRTTSDRLLVEDNTKDSKYLTPVKQGMLKLIKNKNRLSNLFPKLSHVTLEIESDLDEEDAIPSSQESPNTMNSTDRSLNKTCKQPTFKKNFPRSNDISNYLNSKVVDNNSEKNAAKTEASLCKTFAKSPDLSDTACKEKKVSQCSDALLNEIGRSSSLSSKGSSDESCKIIISPCINYAITCPEMIKPMCSTIDLTEDSSIKDDENVDLCKQSSSLSQDVSDSDALQSMQFSISSNNEFQHSIDIIGNSNDSDKSDDAILIDNKKELLNDSPKFAKYPSNSPEPKRRSLRRLTPTRRVQEALLTKHRSSDTMNYKELLQSRNKSSVSRQQLVNSSTDPRYEKFTSDTTKENDSDIIQCADDNHDFNSNTQHPVALNEKTIVRSSMSPTVNRVLFPETKCSDRIALNDLLTKPLTTDCLLEGIHFHDDVEKVKEHSAKKNSNISGAYTDESNSNLPSTDSSWDVFKQDKSISIAIEDINCKELAGENKNLENRPKERSNIECSDPEILLKQSDSSPQAEQEQTPELKSPLSSAATPVRHSQRQKANKAGKLKSIELEKLFSETGSEKKSIHEHSLGTKIEIDCLEAFIQSNTSYEKPKGARKRKNTTPSPSSSLTSPVATRLRARSSVTKQRVVQKSRLRGRPKSRSTSLGIAHRHKPKRLSSVSVKSPTKLQLKDEEKLTTDKELEKEDVNIDTTETRSPLSNEEGYQKQDEARSTTDKKVSPQDKVSVLETKAPSDIDVACKDEKVLRSILPDPSRKRPLTDIKNCRATQRSFNLPISPLSRSQKILRAAIGNFSSIEKSVAWKSSKYVGSPNKSKHINTMQDNSSPDSSKFSSSYWAKQALSPVASPSTGILKKRRLNEDHCNTSPSPPLKQRKVSFADPIVQSNISVVPCDVNERPSRPVSRCLEMPKPLIAIPGQKNEMETKDTSSPSESSLQTSDEYQITPANFYDTNEKVCPDLANCSEPVEGILPYLTCSLFPSGLGQLLRARNIFTIGDVCSLTIPELLRLPVRAPKLETVRKALNTYMEIYQKEKMVVTTKENIKEQNKISLEDKACSENDKELLCSVEAENSSMERIALEKQNYVDESIYVEVDEDMSLTPMPDFDSEDSFLSCDENTRRSQLESLAELHETQNIEASDEISIKNESHNVPQKSVDTFFSNSGYLVNDNTKFKTKIDNVKTEIEFTKDSSPFIRPNINAYDEQENHMEIEESFELSIENENANCEEKACNESSENKSEVSHIEITKSCGSSPVIHMDVEESKQSYELSIENENANCEEKAYDGSSENKSEVSCIEITKSLGSSPVIQMDMEESQKSFDKNQDHHIKQTDYNNSENSDIDSSIVLSAFCTDNVSSAVEQLKTETIGENHYTTDNELEAGINISNVRGSETEITSIQNDLYEQIPACAVEKLDNSVNTELEPSTNISNIIGSKTEIKSMQNDSHEQCTDFIKEQLHNESSSELEANINICDTRNSEAEIKCKQNDSYEQYPDCAIEKLHNTVNNELEASVNISNIRDSETEIKSMQNDSCEQYPNCAIEKLHNTANNELEASFNISHKRSLPLENDYFSQSEQYPDHANEKLRNTANSKLEAGINISDVDYSETEIKFKENDLHEQNPDCAILHLQTEVNFEFDKESELCSEEEISGQDSLDKQQKYCLFDKERGSLKVCCSDVQEMETEKTLAENGENLISTFTENKALALTTAIEPNLPYCCDTQEDITGIVNMLINDVTNEETYEKDVNTEDDLTQLHTNESIGKTLANESQKDITNKNSTMLHIESEKHERYKKTIEDQEVVIISKPTTVCDSATDLNDRLLNTNEEVMTAPCEEEGSNSTSAVKYKMSSPRKGENVIEQSEAELLQSVFTTENLRKVSLLHLVDMMDKLTSAIRIKSEEISHSSNDSRL